MQFVKGTSSFREMESNGDDFNLERMTDRLEENEIIPCPKCVEPTWTKDKQSTSSGSFGSQGEKEEVDSRSVYVGNVDYACTAETVRLHFQSCGIVNRVTILTNEYGQPKGCAFVEFLKIDAVPKALLLDESNLHGRKLKVCTKRTNIPGLKQYRGRITPGYRFVPRFRRSMRYRPY